MGLLLVIVVAVAAALIGAFIILGRPLVAAGLTMFSILGYIAYRIKFEGATLESVAGWVLLLNILVGAAAFVAKEFRAPRG